MNEYLTMRIISWDALSDEFDRIHSWMNGKRLVRIILQDEVLFKNRSNILTIAKFEQQINFLILFGNTMLQFGVDRSIEFNNRVDLMIVADGSNK